MMMMMMIIITIIIIIKIIYFMEFLDYITKKSSKDFFVWKTFIRNIYM